MLPATQLAYIIIGTSRCKVIRRKTNKTKVMQFNKVPAFLRRHSLEIAAEEQLVRTLALWALGLRW
jgi:hypothetical protein